VLQLRRAATSAVATRGIMALAEFPPKRLITIEGTTEERIATILQNL
jgi:hypothetical protein